MHLGQTAGRANSLHLFSHSRPGQARHQGLLPAVRIKIKIKGLPTDN